MAAHATFAARTKLPPRPFLAALGALAVALVFCLSWGGGGLGFSSSLTPGLIEQLAGKFGADARTRLAAWQKFLLGQHLPEERRESLSGRTERDILESVNAFFNRLRFVDDIRHWGVEDYWASPAEMMASGGGDCEDYSIAKYFALKELGVPVARLRITYVKATSINQAHMVLAYYPSPDADPLILDNLDVRIRPASQRPDLIPVYNFNDDDVWITRSGSRTGSSSQIRLWRGLLDKLEKERKI